MKIIVINELKRFFDVSKIQPLSVFNPEDVIHPTTLKIIESCIVENNQEQLKVALKSITRTQWDWLHHTVFSQPLFHIVYFTDKNKYHSKGVNVYAIDMASACEKFTSEFGIDPFYCTVKNKEL